MASIQLPPPPEIDDGPTDADIERFSDVTQKCPTCGTEVFDDVEICWSCGNALTGRENHMKTVWIASVVGAILIAFALVYFL